LPNTSYLAIGGSDAAPKFVFVNCQGGIGLQFGEALLGDLALPLGEEEELALEQFLGQRGSSTNDSIARRSGRAPKSVFEPFLIRNSLALVAELELEAAFGEPLREPSTVRDRRRA
jgi:hypothetical protein